MMKLWHKSLLVVNYNIDEAAFFTLFNYAQSLYEHVFMDGRVLIGMNLWIVGS